MPTVEELGQQVKKKYAGQYDDMSDIDVGRRIKQRFPGQYDDYIETPIGQSEMEMGKLRQQRELRQSVMLNPSKSMHDRIMGFVEAFSKRTALPTTGSLALGYAGQKVAGEPGRYTGQALGGALGEATNQALGITPYSWENIVGAAVSPALARGTAATAGRVLPGATLVRMNQVRQAVDEIIPGLVTKDATADAVTGFFIQAYNSGARIPLQNAGALAAQVAARESKALKGLKYSRVGTLSDEIVEIATVAKGKEIKDVVLSEILDSNGNPIASQRVVRVIPAKDGTIPLDVLDINRQRVGGLIGVTQNQAEKGELKALYKGIMLDIEAAAKAGVPGSAALREGIKMQKRLFAADDWHDQLTQAIGRPRAGDNLQPVNTGALLREMQKVKAGRPSGRFEYFADALAPGDLDDIISLLSRMNKLNVKLLPPMNTQFGSGVNVMRAGAVGGGLTLLGVDPTVAWSVGAASNATAFILSRAMLTPVGRVIINNALDVGNTLNPLQIAAELVMQGARSYYFEPEPQLPTAVTPTPEQQLSTPP